jgi:hypothetical protein
VTPAAYPRVLLRSGSPAVGRLAHRERSTSSVRRRAHRAGPALPSYLALHHAGFSVPPMSPPERWALTPPFHPCLTLRALRRRLAGFPARCHRARSAGGLFSVALSVTPLSRRLYVATSTSSPGVTRRVAHVPSSVDRSLLTRVAPGFCPALCFRLQDEHRAVNVPHDGVRTFLPLRPSSGLPAYAGFMPPFLGLSQRSPGSPAISYYKPESSLRVSIVLEASQDLKSAHESPRSQRLSRPANRRAGHP